MLKASPKAEGVPHHTVGCSYRALGPHPSTRTTNQHSVEDSVISILPKKIPSPIDFALKMTPFARVRHLRQKECSNRFGASKREIYRDQDMRMCLLATKGNDSYFAQ